MPEGSILSRKSADFTAASGTLSDVVGLDGAWVNDLAKQFNDSQKEYRVVPTYKGTYDVSFTAAVAAYRAGQAPHILQVFEVGTATMMASADAFTRIASSMSKRHSSFRSVSTACDETPAPRCLPTMTAPPTLSMLKGL